MSLVLDECISRELCKYYMYTIFLQRHLRVKRMFCVIALSILLVSSPAWEITVCIAVAAADSFNFLRPMIFQLNFVNINEMAQRSSAAGEEFNM